MDMPHYFYLLLAISLLWSCDDADPVQDTENTDLTLSIQAFMGTQGPLELESRTYNAPSVEEGFRVSRLSYYLSEIQLFQTTPNGQDLATDIGEIAYVNFSPDGTADVVFENVPVGDYDRLGFRLGLTAEQDETVPNDYAADNPLGRDSEYWFDWGSYIFLKAEGRADTLVDNQARFDTPFTYHVGRSGTLGRDIRIDYPVTLSTSSAALAINFNAAQLLGLGEPDGVKLRGGLDHANMEALPMMDRAATAFVKAP